MERGEVLDLPGSLPPQAASLITRASDGQSVKSPSHVLLAKLNVYVASTIKPTLPNAFKQTE